METKYHVNVTVDGEEFKNVQFKTKGNSSLSSVARSSSDRYSFKLNFGAFEDGGSSGDREESEGDSRRSQEAAEDAVQAEEAEWALAAESDSGEAEVQEETEPAVN